MENKPYQTKTRFDFDADTYVDAIEYLKNRSIQLLKFDFKDFQFVVREGAVIMFSKNFEDKEYVSIYILKSSRGQKLFDTYYHEYNKTILTTIECQIEDFLIDHEYQYVCIDTWHSEEYDLIKEWYGDKITNRTGVHLINHIDEGLGILRQINAGDNAERAFCLHPIFQSDDDLKKVYYDNWDKIKFLSPALLILVMEYRNIANAYLSTRFVESADEIKLSPLEDVNMMLYADKVQNQKDFLLYHKGKHQRSEQLDEYFKMWLEKLDYVKTLNKS